MLTECLFKQNKGFSSETIGLGPRTKASAREKNASYGERAPRVHILFSNKKYTLKKNCFANHVNFCHVGFANAVNVLK